MLGSGDYLESIIELSALVFYICLTVA